MKIGLIGCGYWGVNYVRVINETGGAELAWCCDVNSENLEFVKRSAGNARKTMDYNDAISDHNLDAVIVSTPANTHYSIVKDCLNAGKHVLVEKPLAIESGHVLELERIAKEKGKVLMVGHIFRFNEGVKKLKSLIDEGTLGNPLYLHFKRTGLGPVRKDVNALWDLAAHDVSMMFHLLKEKPLDVLAKGECYIQDGIEDVVFLTIGMENRVLANIHVSWLDPNKDRKVTVVGDKKMAVFDDISNNPIQIFDKGVSYMEKGVGFADFKALLRDGDILMPKVRGHEPLKAEFAHFVGCIKQGKAPISDVRDGYRVVKVLEAAQESLKTGKKIDIGL